MSRISTYSSINFQLFFDIGTIRNNGSAHKEIQDFVKLTIKNPDFMEEIVAPRIDEALLVLIDKLKESTGDVTVIESLLGYSQDLFQRIAFDGPGSYDLSPGSFGSNLNTITYQLFEPLLFTPRPGDSSELRGVVSYLQDRTSAAASNTDSLAGRLKDYLANLDSPIAQPEDAWRFMFDIFLAGRTNVAEGLAYVIYHLAEDQDLQNRIRQEINGVDSDVTYEDRLKIPRTMSFLYEILRAHTLVPFGLTHVANADGKIGGFDVKKNTRIIPNLYAIHNNPDDWKNPDVFNATRFLRWNGEELTFDPISVNASRVTPFSAGKRSCPGELIPRMTFFKTTISLLRHFQITLSSEMKFDIEENFSAFFLKSREYQAVFEPLL
ncbi:farnesoate epoxidase-like [Lytechinus variegatus]|uniref:farnesoate epoxidase-like n=1 Tax=Lytechinus variegatus TaxID=7654 RepID=UPI001BB1F065|nr:farnesoate epoxidase-like [Lytechinus variegatus]